MTRAEALQFLGATDAHDAGSKIQAAVFDQRDYFLRNTVLPQLLRKRIFHLQKLSEAEHLIQGPVGTDSLNSWDGNFSIPTEDSALATFGINTKNSVLDFFRTYEKALTQGRGQMAMTLNPGKIATLALWLCEVQLAYEFLYHYLFSLYFNEEKSDWQEEVKAAEQVDTGPLILFLEKSGIGTIQIEAAEKLKIKLGQLRDELFELRKEGERIKKVQQLKR